VLIVLRTSSALTMAGMLKNMFGGAESGGVKPDDGKLSVRRHSFAIAAIAGLV
jgi:hypothetical protein